MAAKTGISNERVSVIWRTFGLAPHRAETFQLSTDPHFVEKVRDVVGLYMSPPHKMHWYSVLTRRASVRPLSVHSRFCP